MKSSWLQLYLVTDTPMCAALGVVDTVRVAMRGGVTAVQLRDHDATTRQLCELATQLLEVCRPHGVPLIINDRLDVALAANADGVHLGQNDLDPVRARQIAPNLLIGQSISNVRELLQASQHDPGVLDYVGIGPFRDTATKPNAAPALGLDGVAELARRSPVPPVVIGGVKVGDVQQLRGAGAQGVAVVSAICGRVDPESAARALARQL